MFAFVSFLGGWKSKRRVSFDLWPISGDQITIVQDRKKSLKLVRCLRRWFKEMETRGFSVDLATTRTSSLMKNVRPTISMSMMGGEDDGARAEEVTPSEDDPWSSSPYMDQLAHQSSRPKPLFALVRGLMEPSTRFF